MTGPYGRQRVGDPYSGLSPSWSTSNDRTMRPSQPRRCPMVPSSREHLPTSLVTSGSGELSAATARQCRPEPRRPGFRSSRTWTPSAEARPRGAAALLDAFVTVPSPVPSTRRRSASSAARPPATGRGTSRNDPKPTASRAPAPDRPGAHRAAGAVPTPPTRRPSDRRSTDAAPGTLPRNAARAGEKTPSRLRHPSVAPGAPRTMPISLTMTSEPATRCPVRIAPAANTTTRTAS